MAGDEGVTDLLHVVTAGSVDDGKSTLIGRLLVAAEAVADDVLEAAAETSRRRGDAVTDLSLFTDGLRAEREQGITIDVAYRYFASGGRRFILADTPGHLEYTRNMVTGASRADVGLVLVDATRGVAEQTRRHLALLALLRVPSCVLAVNKMDAVDWSRSVFDDIADQALDHAARLGLTELTALPVSALTGANVVAPSPDLAWFRGDTLAGHLARLRPADPAQGPLRLPVQLVLRRGPGAAGVPVRRYAGQLASGTVSPGDGVQVWPSGRRTVVSTVDVAGHLTERADAPLSVSVTLADDLDVGRGDVIAGEAHPPTVTQDVTATVVWLGEDPLVPGARLLLKHGACTTKTAVVEVIDRLDINTVTSGPAPTGLALHEIGRVRFRTADPLVIDAYADDRRMGSFILISPETSGTVGAGMIVGIASV